MRQLRKNPDGSEVKLHVGIASQISASAVIGENVTIGDYTTIEDHVVIGDGASISSFCLIRQGVRVGPDATIKECVVIDRDSFCGADAVIEQDCYIGPNAELYLDCVVKRSSTVGARAKIKGVADKPVCIIYLGEKFYGFPVTITETHVHVGCQVRTIEEWRSLSEKAIDGLDVNATAWCKKYRPVIEAILLAQGWAIQTPVDDAIRGVEDLMGRHPGLDWTCAAQAFAMQTGDPEAELLERLRHHFE